MKKKYYMFKMNMTFLNIFSILLIIVCGFIFYLLYQNQTLEIFDRVYIPLVILYVPYLMLHELFHSLGYVLFGADFKNITFGVHLEKGVLCCLCKQNINKKNIIFSLLFPFFFIGIVTLILGIIINSPLLVLLSLTNISGCSGDIIMFYHLIKLNNFEFSEYDDPTSFGLFSSEDLSKRKMFGLNYVSTKNKLNCSIDKKVVISKKSIIILALFYTLIIITSLI